MLRDHWQPVSKPLDWATDPTEHTRFFDRTWWRCPQCNQVGPGLPDLCPSCDYPTPAA